MKKAEVLEMLRTSSDHVSGQEICDRFGVSRTAVWKVMNQLKEDGYRIEAVQNRGYRLVESPDVITAEELLSRMNSEWIAREIYYYPEIGSTNTELKKLSGQGAGNGALAVTDSQVAGKGRRGRGWVLPPGSAIAMSLLLKPTIEPSRASMITLVMAMAVASAINQETGLQADIKWPNDIVVNRKKVCGILTEMTMEADYIQDVIVGVGINVNNDVFPEELQETATCLMTECGHRVSRSNIIIAVMEAFEEYYGQFLEAGDLSGLKDAYNQMLVSLDHEVRVLDPKGEFDGISKGINERGELLVEKAGGECVQVYAGEVSVRGLYGYV